MNATILRVLLLLLTLILPSFSVPALAVEMVAFPGKEQAGTIIVRTGERRLYLVVGEGQARKYTVGVGRSGLQWYGRTSIVSKHLRPAWTPPADMRGNRGYFVIESGAPNNPMGEAALVLADHDLAIHGTNNPGSIGGFVSHGCIRMYNADILDLFSRVNIGTPVVMVR